MILETTEIVRIQMQARKTLDEIKAKGFPEAYKNLGTGFVKPDAWITAIYKTLEKK